MALAGCSRGSCSPGPGARPVVGARVLQSEGRSRCHGEAWCPIRRAPRWQGWGPRGGLQVAHLPPGTSLGGAAGRRSSLRAALHSPGGCARLLPGIWRWEGCPACRAALPGRVPSHGAGLSCLLTPQDLLSSRLQCFPSQSKIPQRSVPRAGRGSDRRGAENLFPGVRSGSLRQ